ncbi:NAD-dependent epimerase/dehydratase family protein [Candidatus Enterovibrio escicola]|uniref:NAD-dependent epimerase/dehydratase family protein n=2 Tax=Candidatus Enterovibrio escicola TaxID=1927127 RepID=UPI00123823B2|nr:NAD-dependent epimerase/dehydratase family protein [Candidatus Enterovibrio escacola]
MKILVTGANGFIGRQVVNQSNELIPALRTKHKGLFADAVYYDELGTMTDWSHLLPGIDVIIHLAGVTHNSPITLEELQKVNIRATIHLAKEAAIAGVRRFVFVSSIGVNGNSSLDISFTPDSIPKPHNIYSELKLATEKELSDTCVALALELVIVRPPLVYGPNALGNFALLTKWIKYVGVLPFGNVHNKKDFISVFNLADFLLVCARSSLASGKVFLPSDCDTVSIREFSNEIAYAMRKRIINFSLNPRLLSCLLIAVGKKSLSDQLLQSLSLDHPHVLSGLDWIPPYTLRVSLRMTFDTPTFT